MNEPIPNLTGRGDGNGWSADQRGFTWVPLLAFASFTCLYGLRGGPPMGDHECINALAARNILAGGDWLIPQVHEAPLIRKTPLGVWLIAITGKAAQWLGAAEPVTALTARLPSALAGIGTALVVCWLGSMLYGARIGLVAGFIAAGSAGIIGFGRNAQVDMVLAFFVTLSMACFWRGALHGERDRRYLAAFYISFAMAMLAKAPLPLVMVGLPLAVYLLGVRPMLDTAKDPRIGSRMGRWGAALRLRIVEIATYWLIPGVALFIVIVAAWPIYVASKVDTAVALWRIEYLSRFTGDLSDKVKPFHYYIPIVFGLLFPFLASLPEALAAPFLRRYRAHSAAAHYVFVWAVVGTVFLSSSSFKRPHYLLSVLPAYCLLLAPVIDRLFFQAGGVTRAARATCMILPGLLPIGAVVGGWFLRREAPQLMTTYVITISAAVIAWSLACWAYARDRRVTSFALLNLATVVALIVAWPALSTGAGLNRETEAMAAAMRKAELDPARTVYWMDGQPNSTLPFYHGVRIRRLISEVEMASIRTGRASISEEVYAAAAKRVQERLRDEPPAYFVVSAEHFDLLGRRTDMTIRELFRLSGVHEDAEDELVVFTRGGAKPSPAP